MVCLEGVFKLLIVLDFSRAQGRHPSRIVPYGSAIAARSN